MTAPNADYPYRHGPEKRSGFGVQRKAAWARARMRALEELRRRHRAEFEQVVTVEMAREGYVHVPREQR
jgi:hypothetical protein